MNYSPALLEGKLIKRYKRFLADVRLADDSVITIHCPNTGSMKNCLFEGHRVWFSTSDNPKRKYPHTWELMESDQGHLIGINTGNANALAQEAIESGVITELQGYDELKREVKYGAENSRIDILLSSQEGLKCYIEVKSCTLLEGNTGYFPDAVTSRGQKHIRELVTMVQQGHRAVLLFVVQHSGISTVKPAAHIDAKYADLLKDAIEQGVEVLAYKVAMSTTGGRIETVCKFIV
ncbi:DNA/RNA nuclease SfsA [Shewanella maritima]|uniref:Sugar fermentation stimulation protein homolog n=1 Tax=Shewanella maritima TaxID=2520507 RepID=A0A411PFH9_9GAMM|nr:DNA/RNA nuclease SfsA [Shewanella maritima]QBF82356.1 DNA/RNA nuclease SfsA [Shewanella maritima]